MSQSITSFGKRGANIVRAEVHIIGTRPLLQHAFGPDAIPLEKAERSGVAGNDPEEWKRSMLVTGTGKLYIRNTYVFGCLRKGSSRTKKGRGSIQPDVEATLEVEPATILLNVSMPKGDLTRDPTEPVYIDVQGVVNRATKGRNVRYRLAASPGWKCSFIMQWDKTVVSREQMQAVLRDAGTYGGIGDGLKIGCGRFSVVSYKELDDAEDEAPARTVEHPAGESVGTGRPKVRSLHENGEVDGVPHRPSAKR